MFPQVACLRDVWPQEAILRQGFSEAARTHCSMLQGLLNSITDEYDEGNCKDMSFVTLNFLFTFIHLVFSTKLDVVFLVVHFSTICRTSVQ